MGTRHLSRALLLSVLGAAACSSRAFENDSGVAERDSSTSELGAAAPESGPGSADSGPGPADTRAIEIGPVPTEIKGASQPGLFELALATLPEGLALDDTNVYWVESSLKVTNGNTVMKVPKLGGEATVVLEGDPESLAMAIGGTNLYFKSTSVYAEPSSGLKLVRLPGATSAVPFQGFNRAVAATPSNVYGVGFCSAPLASSLNVYPSAGGPKSNVLSTAAGCGSVVAVGPAGFYWTAPMRQPSQTTIYRASIGGMTFDGSASRILYGGAPIYFDLGGGGSGDATVVQSIFPSGVAADDTNIYWTDLGNPPATDGSIMKMRLPDPLATGPLATPTVLVSGVMGPRELIRDGATLYYTTSDAIITKISVDGGNPTMLATDQVDPRELAVDATSIYWINHGNRAVMRLTPK